MPDSITRSRLALALFVSLLLHLLFVGGLNSLGLSDQPDEEPDIRATLLAPPAQPDKPVADVPVAKPKPPKPRRPKTESTSQPAAESAGNAAEAPADAAEATQETPQVTSDTAQDASDDSVSPGSTGTATCAMIGPPSSSPLTKCTVTPATRQPASSARWCVCRPVKAGSSDGCMLIIRPP